MDALDLLFRRLVLSAREAGALGRPLDVGEVLDKLVPYRTARRDGALDTNDDYLHAMMRLLSGERSLVYADELIQDDLLNELESPNPDLTLLRTYLNTKIRLATAEAQRVMEGDTEIDLRPHTPASSTPAMGVTPTMPTDAVDAPASDAEPTSGPSRMTGTVHPGCPYCSQPLPQGRHLKYCPSCGQNLLIRRCAGCSAEIESGWKFCVTCGRAAS